MDLPSIHRKHSPRLDSRPTVRDAGDLNGFLGEREFFIDNLLVRIHLIIEMIWWTGLAPWEFEFPFPGSPAWASRICIKSHKNKESLGTLSRTTQSPMWGYPVLVLGAISSFLEPFRGRLSPKVDNVSKELTLRYPHEGPWVVGWPA